MSELRNLLNGEQDLVKVRVAELEHISKEKEEMENNLKMEIQEMNKAQVDNVIKKSIKLFDLGA